MFEGSNSDFCLALPAETLISFLVGKRNQGMLTLNPSEKSNYFVWRCTPTPTRCNGQAIQVGEFHPRFPFCHFIFQAQRMQDMHFKYSIAQHASDYRAWLTTSSHARDLRWTVIYIFVLLGHALWWHHTMLIVCARMVFTDLTLVSFGTARCIPKPKDCKTKI